MVEVSEVIKSLTCLRLTEAGEVKLTAFPDGAITEAAKNLGRSHRMNPMKWFIDECVKYCNDNDMKPNWRSMYELAEERGIDLKANPPLLEKKDKVSSVSRKQTYEPPPKNHNAEEYDEITKNKVDEIQYDRIQIIEAINSSFSDKTKEERMWIKEYLIVEAHRLTPEYKTKVIDKGRDVPNFFYYRAKEAGYPVDESRSPDKMKSNLYQLIGKNL